MLDQKELDVIEVMNVLALLEVVGRCLGGIEDVANPNDVEHAVWDVLLAFDDALDVHLVDVHHLLVFDLLDALLALDTREEGRPPVAHKRETHGLVVPPDNHIYPQMLARRMRSPLKLLLPNGTNLAPQPPPRFQLQVRPYRSALPRFEYWSQRHGLG